MYIEILTNSFRVIKYYEQTIMVHDLDDIMALMILKYKIVITYMPVYIISQLVLK